VVAATTLQDMHSLAFGSVLHVRVVLGAPFDTSPYLRRAEGSLMADNCPSNALAVYRRRWHRRRMRFVYIIRCRDGSLYVGETGEVP
jgi:hypothetical protein